jgi:hypothetical protein
MNPKKAFLTLTTIMIILNVIAFVSKFNHFLNAKFAIEIGFVSLIVWLLVVILWVIFKVSKKIIAN